MSGSNYIYAAFVDGELRYIGRGVGARYNHCSSGMSSCYELNRDHFIGRSIDTRIIIDGLSGLEAERVEASAISSFDGLYNKLKPAVDKKLAAIDKKKVIKAINKLDLVVAETDCDDAAMSFLTKAFLDLKSNHQKLKVQLKKIRHDRAHGLIA